ncbi:VOC family protein [Cochleicola gelatinilyticus]|uniref:Glyoxalase n=1 Tax=Cochleicola gelatinilyticus TaxID=1763537 RepID=A0A167K6Y0_9FLAO|nr:VOC family protein [Cochleicola gelatinilyticus]OAB81451.1 glyoxalase [Cochleicola gelatinilyticus]
MKLGAFSISLNVKDIHASKAFYEAVGFTIFAGDIEKNYLIMKNENTLIGLFQGMFPTNILTFNPGWDQDANTLKNFDDIRTIQKELKQKGISFQTEVAADSSGPAHFTLVDPDGNAILFDQHI